MCKKSFFKKISMFICIIFNASIHAYTITPTDDGISIQISSAEDLKKAVKDNQVSQKNAKAIRQYINKHDYFNGTHSGIKQAVVSTTSGVVGAGIGATAGGLGGIALTIKIGSKLLAGAGEVDGLFALLFTGCAAVVLVPTIAFLGGALGGSTGALIGAKSVDTKNKVLSINIDFPGDLVKEALYINAK